MTAPSGPGRRQVYLIQCRFPPSYWGMENFLKLTPYKAVFPPLGLLTLAALAPPEFAVTICDENVGEAVDFDTDAEIVGITGYIIQMPRVFELADRFRALGKTVVIGGPLANLLPEECRPRCDILFEGEAEYTWPQFLRDYAAGTHADHYHQEEKIHLPDSPPPKVSALKSRYAHGIVQCSRGCPFTCEFCDIIVMYGRKMRFKPVEQVLKEVQAWKDRGVDQVFFADDNFIGNRAYAKELLRALAKWNAGQRHSLAYYTQASIDMVRDEELMELLRDANFISVFIGIESPRKESLAETKKLQNERIDLVEAIHKVQSYNLFVSAGMIVGFDSDDADIFDEQYEFLQKAGIPTVMMSTLLAVPKTPLYKRLEEAGRLRKVKATGADPARFVGTNGGTNFEPLNMTMEELKAGQQRLYRKLYSPEAFAHRLLGNMSHFKDVHFREGPLRLDNIVVFFKLARRYWRQGGAARKFFFSSLWKAWRRSPRSVSQVVVLLGMYLHVSEVHADQFDWSPWTGSLAASETTAPRETVAVGS